MKKVDAILKKYQSNKIKNWIDTQSKTMEDSKKIKIFPKWISSLKSKDEIELASFLEKELEEIKKRQPKNIFKRIFSWFYNS